MQRSTLAKRVWLLLFLAVIACYFYALGRPALLGPDEPRYAQVAREMFMRGDPITPTLGGYTWFEKPSLLYWMMMASYGAFGTTEFAARFGPACAGLLTALMLYWLGRRIERACEEREKPRGLGRWSSLAAATSAGLIVFSRGASFDIIITMTVTLALSLLLCFRDRARCAQAHVAPVRILRSGRSLFAGERIGRHRDSVRRRRRVLYDAPAMA